MAEDNKAQNSLSKALEITEETRKFETITGESYIIKSPSSDDIRKADLSYSKAYSDALVSGIFTASEMVDILKRRGIIGPEYEQRATELTGDIAQKITQLGVEEDREEKHKLALEIKELREQIFQWNQRLNGPMSNTCEQIADESRVEFLTSCMVFKDDGSRLWPKFEDYRNEKNRNLQFKARFEVMLYLQGLDSNFLENTPEEIALRKIHEEVIEEIDEKLEAVKAEAEAAKEESEKEPEDKEKVEKSKEEEEPDKKRGRSKTKKAE